MDRNADSPTAGKPRQAPVPTPQRVFSTMAGPGHAQRQVSLAEEIGGLADEIEPSETSEERDEAEDSLIKALRWMGIKALKHFDP